MISSSEASKPWTTMSSPQTATFAKTKKPFVKPFMPRLVRSKAPDHIIGYGSTIQGRFEFAGLLRVEGRFEGVLKPAAGASVSVTRTGVIVGDIDGCHSVTVDGTVVGNVTASLADLRRHAHVEGNVWCKDLVAASSAAFRNRAAVTAVPPTRRRSSSASRSSSGSFEAGEVAASKAAAAVSAAVGDWTEGSATEGSTCPSALGPALPLGPVAVAPPAEAEAATLAPPVDCLAANATGGWCPVMHHTMAAAPAAAAADADTTVVTALPPPTPPQLSTRSRCDGRSVGQGGGYNLRAETDGGPFLAVRASGGGSGGGGGGTCGRGGGSVLAAPALATGALKDETPPREHWEGGNRDEKEVEEEGREGGTGGRVSSASNGLGTAWARHEVPYGGEGFSGCPIPRDLRSSRGVADSDRTDSASERTDGHPEQRHVWRDCTKMYGVKCYSLTKAFSSVAVMLKFDEDMVFEEHLQMEYAAENLWFWKRGMNFRSTHWESFEARRAAAKSIYDAFLAVDATDQVNISHEDREAVLAALEGRPGAQAIGSGLFDDALIQVENMLALGPFPRFADGTVKNVDKSWGMVLERLSIEDVGETFYSVLFEIAPFVERMFTRSKRVQGQMLMEIINSSVALLKNLQDLVPMLIQLGLRHNAYKVKAEHYPIVGDALVATLSLALGKSLTPEMRQSWIAIYALVSNIMISMLDEEEDIPRCAEGASPVGSDISRQSSIASLAMGPRATARVDHDAAAAVRHGGARGHRGEHGEPSGSGGGGTTSAMKGMYRRSANSFRNRFNNFAFVRKETTNNNDLASARRPHGQQQHQPRRQQQQPSHRMLGTSSKSNASSTPPAPSSTAASTSSSSDTASVASGLIGGVAPSTAPPAIALAPRPRGGRRQGGNTRALLGLG